MHTLVLLLTLLLPAAVRADILDDYWYNVEIQGKKCGHMHAWTVKDAGRFTTRAEIAMKIKRGESVVPVLLSTEFVETSDAKPIRMRAEKKLGAMPMVDEFIWGEGGVQVKHSVAGSKQEDKRPFPEGDWLTPAALEKFIETKIAAGEKEISARALDPTAGLKPVRQTMKLLEKTTLDVVGKTVPALKWTTTNDFMPNVESISYTDEKGIPLRSEDDLGEYKLVIVRADKAVALAKADPPELLESTFIRPDKAIPSPRDSSLGEYTVSSGDAPIGDWPTAGAQTITKVDDHTVKVRVEAKRTSVVPADEAERIEFRKPSSMVNSEDVEVLHVRTEAIKGHEKDGPAARAEAMRRHVSAYIRKKTFDVGFASAAETARTRTGDCSEHAVLLCAILRADGIPSRCVSGLVYVEGAGTAKGFFGYHMWTQAMLPDEGAGGSEVGGKALRWVDLDAAISSTTPMDATHLAIKPISLADGETVNALVEIVPTLGKLRIKVGEVK